MRIEYQDASKLAFFKGLYDEARAAADEELALMDRHMKQYKGSAEIDGSSTPAKVVRNVTYEIIESQISTFIPTPKVSPLMFSEKNERNAKSIEMLLKSKRNALPFERMNDLDERYSPIYGGSVWLVEFDNSIVTHNTVGDVRVTCLPPSKFTGQPYIYDIADMEYCFIEFETTREDIVRKYDVSIDTAEEAESEENADDKTATLYICYYRNDDGKICQYIWSGDTEILDIDDYYARKRCVCTRCGKRREICTCEEPTYEMQSEDCEELDRDIQQSDGTVIPMMSPVIEDGVVKTHTKTRDAIDEAGNVMMEDIGGVFLPVPIEVQVPVMAPTRIPFYRPSLLPVVIRKNTSQENKLFGQSDCEFIRSQQQAINKLESRILEKLISGGVYPIVPEGFSVDLDESIFKKVFKAKPDEMGRFGKMDLQANVAQDVNEAERLYDQIKRQTGISDSFQGQYDASAKSGIAKQVQVQQSQGRLASKRMNKNAAYADIDHITFQLYLAFADEPRPATYRDAHGMMQNIIFSRYDFLKMDDAGEYYYDDQFLFSADESVDADNDRETLWQENRLNFQQGAYGPPDSLEARLLFWQIQEKLHYPWSNDIVERLKEELNSQLQAALNENAAFAREVQGRVDYEDYLKGEIMNRGGMRHGNQSFGVGQ